VAAGVAPGVGGGVTEYLIAFNDDRVPYRTVEELREKSKAVRALVAEMKAAESHHPADRSHRQLLDHQFESGL
jgi:hypothetical protein